MGVCYVVGNGEPTKLDFTLNSGDYLVACDGGYRRVAESGLKADCIIGDFDSLGAPPAGEKNVIALNPVKDVTDVGAAVEYAFGLGYRKFRFYCCSGGSLSHYYANIQTVVSLARKGAQALLVGREENIAALHDGALAISCESGGSVSVFAADVATGVDITGMKYPLKNHTLTNDFPLGVSNEITDNTASVSVKTGTLIVIFPTNASYSFKPFSSSCK